MKALCSFIIVCIKCTHKQQWSMCRHLCSPWLSTHYGSLEFTLCLSVRCVCFVWSLFLHALTLSLSPHVSFYHDAPASPPHLHLFTSVLFVRFGWWGIQPPKKRLDYNPDYSTHAVAQVNLPSCPSIRLSFAVCLLYVSIFLFSFCFFSCPIIYLPDSKCKKM